MYLKSQKQEDRTRLQKKIIKIIPDLHWKYMYLERKKKKRFNPEKNNYFERKKELKKENQQQNQLEKLLAKILIQSFHIRHIGKFLNLEKWRENEEFHSLTLLRWLLQLLNFIVYKLSVYQQYMSRVYEQYMSKCISNIKECIIIKQTSQVYQSYQQYKRVDD